MSNLSMIYVPGEVLSLVIGVHPYVVQAAHPNFLAVVEAAKSGDPEQIALIPDLINIAKSVAIFTEGKITVDQDAGTISFNGEVVHNYICDRILTMMEEGFNVDPMVKFLENLMQNPSKRAVDELYSFLEYGKMPLTEDGQFLAYKRVRNDYKSVHDGKTDNSLGAIVEMPRNRVNDNKDETCSNGLHFCSVGYLQSYSGEKIVVLKINPRDVVSIPTDYKNTKGRACRYEVVGELTHEQVEQATGGKTIWNTSVVTDYDPDQDDADREFEDDLDLLDYQWLISTPSYGFEAGYNAGYVDGRSKLDDASKEHADSEFKNGYIAGYKDGRGHKSRQFFNDATSI